MVSWTALILNLLWEYVVASILVSWIALILNLLWEHFLHQNWSHVWSIIVSMQKKIWCLLFGAVFYFYYYLLVNFILGILLWRHRFCILLTCSVFSSPRRWVRTCVLRIQNPMPYALSYRGVLLWLGLFDSFNWTVSYWFHSFKFHEGAPILV